MVEQMIAKIKTIYVLTFGVPALFAQGSLTPPGAPSPSMKTLGQIEPRVAIESLPYKITREGSYYVAANLVVPNGTNGISIQAGSVSLDLGGFTIRGMDDSNEAILIAPGYFNVSIRNGLITSTSTGVEASGAAKIKLEGITVTVARGNGISVGADSVVDRCQVNGTDGTGIKTGARGQVRNSQATENLGPGFDLGQGSTLRECMASRNSASGVYAAGNARILGVSAQENAGTGIDAGNNSSLVDCTANQNQGSGIRCGSQSLVSRAAASFNFTGGIVVGPSSSVLDSNASANAWLGVYAGAGTHIANTKVEGNAAGGISAQEGSTVRDCTASRNTNDGILVTSECTVVRNACNNNVNLRAASGIHASGTDNVIQENNLVSNDRGLALDVEGNLVTRNSATNNSLNYYVIGNQTMGPIVSELDNAASVSPVSNFAF